MFRHLVLETRQPGRCQKCGGQLIRSDGEINCLQCSAPHTAEGKLAIYSAQEFHLISRTSGKNPNRKRRDYIPVGARR